MTIIAVCVWDLWKNPKIPWWVYVAVASDIFVGLPSALRFYGNVFG